MSGLLTTDSDEKVTSFNPEAERIIAARASEVIGSELEAVIPGVRKLVRRASEWEVPAGSRRARLRIENRRGEQLHLGVASSVLRDAGGNPAGHVVIFQDVTSVVAMEEDLRRSERMAAIGEMGAKIAHEIRNPLAAISGSIEILGKSGTRSLSGSEPARLMDIVVRETDRLNRLITNFLNYARPTPLKLSRVCLETLVAEVLEMFEAVRPRSVEVVATELKPVSVAADAEQLRQVVWNLCLNGVQAMGEGGRLVLRTGLLASDSPQALSLSGRNETTEVASLGTGGVGVWAEISVSDTGMGISPEVRDRMFEPFFTTKREGTGLGLATVHRVVESHGGVLQLESEEGKGTVVRVLLPCVESSA
jgi:two-component system sensor histidine kinase PilS (NtrC family)